GCPRTHVAMRAAHQCKLLIVIGLLDFRPEMVLTDKSFQMSDLRRCNDRMRAIPQVIGSQPLRPERVLLSLTLPSLNNISAMFSVTYEWRRGWDSNPTSSL